jgi:hypothetical protein
LHSGGIEYHGGVNKKVLLPLTLIVVFAISRWPHLMPQNFSAAYAAAFCAGLYLPGAMAWYAPLVLMGLMDAVIHFVFYSAFPFSWTQFAGTEIGYVGLIGLGQWLGKKKPWWALVGGGLGGAVIFYLITNFASWLYLPYAKTLAGLIQALTGGFPGYPPTWEFFRNTLMSGGLFTGLFVGAMKASEAAEEKEEEEQEAEQPAPKGEEAEA